MSRVNPLVAGEHYVGKIVVDNHAWTQDISWLLSPAVAAVVFAALVPLLGGRFIKLRGGVTT
jgi:ABC-2 type transport system permease protein